MSVVEMASDRLLMMGIIAGGLVAGVSFAVVAPDVFGQYKQERLAFEAQFPSLTPDEQQKSQIVLAEYGRQSVDAILAGQVIPTPASQVIEARSVLNRDSIRDQQEIELMAPYQEKFGRSEQGIIGGAALIAVCAALRKISKK